MPLGAYRTVEAQLPAFSTRHPTRPIADFVAQELRAFLRCGLLAHTRTFPSFSLFTYGGISSSVPALPIGFHLFALGSVIATGVWWTRARRRRV